MNTGKLSIQYLQHDSLMLGPISERLRQIRHWNRLLADAIPEDSRPLLQHCHIIHADKTTLTLVTDSPHWATRLRFLTPKLLAALKTQPEFSALTTIRHKVIPLTSGKASQRKGKKNKQLLSQRNAELLKHTAETVRHPGLRAVLRKMAKGMS